MHSKSPRVTFALPVRNGGDEIRRCLDSLLNQDHPDFEIVVSDNASTDGTQDVIRNYAARDPRVRPFFNEEDIGQIENFNRVVRLARGEFFRWIGAEDWLEPDYASTCLAAFDADPGAIVVTNYFRIHVDGGAVRYREYQGELLESERPERRFGRLMWSFHAGDAVYEPLYSLIRLSALRDTSLIRMMVKADRILAAELCLIGRFHHIRRCLSYRWKPMRAPVHSAEYLRRYRPRSSAELQSNAWRQFRCLLSVIWAAPLTLKQRLLCLWPAFQFFVIEQWILGRRKLNAWRRGLGISRRNLGLADPAAGDRGEANEPRARCKTIFVDRDDTIVPDRGHLDNVEGIELLDGAGEALRSMKALGFKIVLITNQSGVGRGYFPESIVHAQHDRLAELLSEHDVEFDAIRFCPHAPTAGCECRKPKAGMIQDAGRELETDFARSWMIGNAESDVAAGRAAGCRTIQITPDVDLVTAARIIAEDEDGRRR